MPRTVNRTPRHLDDPTRLGPLTLAQWVLLALAVGLVWLILRNLAFLPLLWRIVAGAVVVGLTVGITEGGGGRSLAALPRRAWHSLTTPAEHFPGEARRGPLRFETYDDAPQEEDPPDA